MNDSLWFFAKGLLWGVLLLNFLLALHPLAVLLRDYFASQQRYLTFEPTMDPALVPYESHVDPEVAGRSGGHIYPGFLRIVFHNGLLRYRHSPSSYYRIRPRYLLGNPSVVLYYLVDYHDPVLGTVTAVCPKGDLNTLLLASAEVARHGVAEHRYQVGQLTMHTPSGRLEVPVMLEGNYVALGCANVLVRDVLQEIETHLGAEVRAQMRTWKVPALRTHVERPAYT